MVDIYDEAVADAKKLRQKTTQVVEQQLLEKFRPKIDRYIASALLEADSSSEDEDSEDILLGVDVAAGDEMGGAPEPTAGDKSDIAADVAASIEGGSDGESAALQINSDGTITLDLDKVVIPEEPGAGTTDVDAAGTGTAGDAAVAKSNDLIAGDVKESLKKLDALCALVECIDNQSDKFTAYKRLAEAYDKVVSIILPKGTVGKQQLAGLTNLAERINTTYLTVRDMQDATTGKNSTKKSICMQLETTYKRVNNILIEAVCTKIAKKISHYEREVTTMGRLNETARTGKKLTLYKNVDSTLRILEAVADRVGPTKTSHLKDRIAKLVKEINMVTRKKALNEEEVIFKLELPDEETKSRVVDALGGSAMGGDMDDMGDDMGSDDDDLGSLFGDEEDEAGDDSGESEDMFDESDDFGGGSESSAMEARRAAADLANLFEADDDEPADDDAGDEGDTGDDDMSFEDDSSDEGSDEMSFEDEGGESSEATSALEKIADIVRDAEGGVSLEIVDDEMDSDLDIGGEEPADEDMLDMGMDDESADEDMPDMEEGDGYGFEADEPDGEEMVEVDMRQIANALREMDSRYHKHETPGPDKGLGDFGGATETSEPFGKGDELEESMKRRLASRRRTNRLSEAKASSPSAREVYMLRRDLAESKRKQGENSLLSVKLLYTNKLLQRSDLTDTQRSRIVDAMDEAGNLREAKLLYNNMVRAFDKRANRLNEGRTRTVGSASQVTTSGGLSRNTGGGSNDNQMLNENIDLDLWKRHAGLE